MSEEESSGLTEKVETTRFVGSEFLVWLWFKAEILGGNFTRPGGEALELWLDSRLTLQSTSDATERVQFSGVAPSATPEAKLALSHNKLPTLARVALSYEERDFSFVFDAVGFSFGTVKLPEMVAEGEEEQFTERMDLLELLDQLWGEQYAEFLRLRQGPLWETSVMPWILDWLGGAEGPSAAQLTKLCRAS